MPQMLHMRLLGDFSLALDDEPVTGVNTARLHSLLAYLVLHRDTPQFRQHLAFRFWPDSSEAQARNNLRQTLHALRLALPNADAFLAADTNTLRWRPDAPLTLDVADFEQALRQAGAAAPENGHDAALAALEQAASIYRGDLLPACYDEWIMPERERLRQRHLQALDQLLQLLEARGDYAAAIGYAQRLIRHDALNEDAYRDLMRLLALKGDRAGAVRVYYTCATTLQRELGVAPSPPTRAAYEQLLRMEDMAAPAEEPRPALAVIPSLIGRDREWRQLQAAWERAQAGAPVFVLVTGEAGIGKSRLAEEMLRWCAQRGATTAKTGCYAAEGRLSLAPVTDWLRSDGLRPHLAQLDHVWLAEVSRILPQLASEYPDLPRYEPISEYGQRQRFFEALARAVLAAPQPLLLLIDDLQWCDQETIEWLHFLLRYASSARLMLIGSARVEELAPQHPLRTLLLHLRNTIGVTELALEPLDAAETARLAAVIAQKELGVNAAMHLYRETEGNPLFVVEMMRAGLDRPPQREGQAQGELDDGGVVAAPSLPPRVRAVIAGRLAQLSPPARELAATAAAIGRAFSVEVLMRAANADEDAAVRALDELWQRRIVREQGTNLYDFTHDKLREVAYDDISAPQRRLLHRRIAQALEVARAGDLDAVSGRIASHYERAGLAAQAIPYYQRAAEVARSVYANADAITFLSRALALLEDLPGGVQRDTRELRLLLALAPLYRITRGWTAPELERVIDRALVLCDTVGTDEQHAEALYGLESILVVQAKLEQVRLASEELGALLERTPRAAPPMSGMMAAGALLHLGRLRESNEAFERMIADYDTTQLHELRDMLGWNHAVLSRAWQAHGLWCLGYPERALSRGREAVQLAHELGQPFNQALAATYQAMLEQLCVEPDAGRVRAEEAHTLAVEYQAPYYRTWAAILARYGRAWEQPDASHLARLRQSIEEFKTPGARLRLPYYLGLLAAVHAHAGSVEEGLAVVEEALGESRAHDERWWDAELHRLRAELMRARGEDARDVEAALGCALEIARAQQARSLELRAAMSLGRLWAERDRGADARRLLADVYGWFTEGFETPNLRAARALLDALA